MQDPFCWPPRIAQRQVGGRWWFAAALVAVACGWWRLVPRAEVVPLEVIIATPDNPDATAVANRLVAALEGQAEVASATVSTLPSEEPCETTIEHLVESSPHRPVALLLVNPVGGDDLAAAARLAARARRAGVSVGAIVERPESAPGVSILLPSRWAPPSGDTTRLPGNGAVLMLAVRGLHRLEAPIELLLRGLIRSGRSSRHAAKRSSPHAAGAVENDRCEVSRF